MSAFAEKPKNTPTIPRPAACVVLVRPTVRDDSYQILLVERMARDGSQYLNAHVFPGGQAEAIDHDDLRRSALRELYEEASIHLLPDNSHSRPGRVIPQDVTVNISQTPYTQFLETTLSSTAESNLIPYSRWITPNTMPKRFDSVFFLALANPSDAPVHGKADGQEIKSVSWFTPSEALSRFSNGEIILFPPQWYILSDLKTSCPSFSELLRVVGRLPKDLLPMVPQTLKVSRKGFTMALYGDEDYKSEDGSESRSKSGARHRMVVEFESGRPRRMTLERTDGIFSKL